MKIIISFFALLLSVSFIAQTNYTLNGNLGVGEAPTHKLSVAGDSKMTGELTVTEKTKLEADVEIDGDLKLSTVSTSGTDLERLLYIDENGNVQKITAAMLDDLVWQLYDFECASWSVNQEPMWANSPGILYADGTLCNLPIKMGVNTSVPSASLEVNSAQEGYAFKATGIDYTEKAFAVTNGLGDKFYIKGDGQAVFNLQSFSSTSLSVNNTSNEEVFSLKGSGQVSIFKQTTDNIAFNIQDELDNDVFRIMGNGLVIATEIKVRLKE